MSQKPINQLAQTPTIGWNSFDSYGVYLYEKAAMANLEAFAEKLKPPGNSAPITYCFSYAINNFVNHSPYPGGSIPQLLKGDQGQFSILILVRHSP